MKIIKQKYKLTPDGIRWKNRLPSATYTSRRSLFEDDYRINSINILQNLLKLKYIIKI